MKFQKIKTFEDACEALNLDSKNVIPDFTLFPKEEVDSMVAHAKLIIIAKAINGDWKPDWNNGKLDKYYPWFDMRSSASGGFAYDDDDGWNTGSIVGSRLCYETSEKAKYAGTQFLDLYKTYFVKQ